MSRFSIDEEQLDRSPAPASRETLARHWASAREEPAPQERRGLSQAALDALQAGEPEEGVRIYQPGSRRNGKPAPAVEKAEPAPAPQPEDEEEEEERPARRPIAAVLGGLLQRLKREKAPAPSGQKPAPQPPAEELPSFEELLWGEEKAKRAPVRILEEEPAPAKEPAAPAAEEELSLSVDDILAEYWSGLSEEAETPAPAPRRRRDREQEKPAAPRSGRRTQTPAKPAPRAEKAEPVPAPAKPAPAVEKAQPEPTPPVTPPPAPAEDAFSVDAILSDFWNNYTEQEESPAAPASAPRSRREAARLREEAAPVPPTGAASSAADGKSASRRRKDRRSRTEKPPRRTREKAEKRPPRTPAAERPARTEPEAPPAPAAPPEPEPVDPAEAGAMFGFLRRNRPEPEPAPRPEPPRPAPAKPREIIDEDVFGAMSVDDIVAEYNDILAALPEAAAAVGAEKAAEAAPDPREEPAPSAASRGQVSRMQEEARGLLRQMRSGELSQEAARPQSGLRRETAQPQPEDKRPARPAEPVPAAQGKPAPAMPSLSDAEWNETMRRLLGQDPAPPQPAAMAEPSSAPAQSYSRPRRSVLPPDEVDPRFNLSGQRKSAMVFDGKELDLSADESYVPPKPVTNVGYHWVAGEEELPEKPLEKKPLFGRKKAPAPPAEEPERSEGYDDRAKPSYAPDRDYEPEEDEEAGPGAFPTFGQYLSSLVSGVLVRLLGAQRRGGSVSAATMEDEEELGPEVSPAAASKYYGSFVNSLRLRLRIALALLALLAWIALGLPVSGALRSAPVAAGLSLAIQLTILLLGLDVVTGAAVNMARGRFGADSLAVVSCVLTSLDALAVCLGVLGTPHMPLCLISSASFLGVLLSSLVSARGLRKALRVPAIGKRCYGVTAETQVKGSGLTLLKSLRPPKGFVRRTEEAAPDETLFLRLAPILGILALVLSLVVAIAKHAFGEFLFILTALLCPAVPLTALLAFALPYLFGSLRIFHSGAAIAGWSGVSDIGSSDNLIVTDRDLFPEGSVQIDTVRIFAEVQPETVISYAGTMICASGSDLAPCFAELMEKNGCPMRRVEGYEYLAGGGMKGVIDGSVILCGGLDLMRLMNVRVPYRLVGKTTVLLAVDGILCGIFNMKYEGQPQVRKALVGLIRSNRHPVFAIRDFLVTPDMLSDCFEVATDGYDFPPYVDRFAISEAKPSEESKLAAVVCREGLGPLSHMADTGRSIYVATRLNLLLTALAAVLGVFVVFFKLLSAGTVASGFLLLFLLLWALPVAAISVFLRL